MLKIYSKPEYVPKGSAEFAALYRKITYKTADVSSDELFVNHEDDVLKNTDYFLVSLGSDEENTAIAFRLREAIREYHLSDDNDKKNCNNICCV